MRRSSFAPSALRYSARGLAPAGAARGLARAALALLGPARLALELAHRLEPLGVELAGARSPPAPRSPARSRGCSRRSGSCAASSAMSANASSMPPPPASVCSRSPGVSISSAPLGRTNSSRWVVAWRPRSSRSRISQRPLALLAEQRVDERRLADAGHAEQRRGPAAAEVRVEVGQAPAVVHADRDGGSADRALDLRGDRERVGARGRPS